MKATVSVSGGQRLAARLDQIRRQLTDRGDVYVGIPKSAGSYEDGAPLAVIGAVQEFGSADGHIPERSFLRVPLRSNQELFAKIWKNQIPLVIDGTITMMQLFDQLGARAVGVSQQAISAGINPPNAPSTIRQKGSSTTLVDTGRMRQAVTYVIREGGE